MLRVNYVPSHFEYIEVIKKICTLFPSEDPAIYYIPPDKTHRNAQGKLPNKVRNIKYNLQKKNAGTLPSASVQHAFDALGKIKITAPAKLKGLQTVGFNEHLHSYEIIPTPEWLLIEYKDLVSFYPSTAHVGSDGNTYVIFRYIL
ncbi:uncharacterized protein [Temnothorax nylanderi]|uniref:uncharacterized protein n=1 Tax=Temnothorax nylanderi TaxID=102681 RepID=UPI003A83DC9C